MNHRTLAAALGIGTLLLVLFGYLLYAHPSAFGLCPSGEQCLSDRVFYGVANPLYLHVWPLVPLFFALMFVPQSVFRMWTWYALPLGFLGLGLIVAAPPMAQGFFVGLPDRPQMTAYVVRLFAVGSVLVVIAAGFFERWKART